MKTNDHLMKLYFVMTINPIPIRFRCHAKSKPQGKGKTKYFQKLIFSGQCIFRDSVQYIHTAKLYTYCTMDTVVCQIYCTEESEIYCPSLLSASM